MWGFYFLKNEPLKLKRLLKMKIIRAYFMFLLEKFLLCTFQYILHFIYKNRKVRKVKG